MPSFDFYFNCAIFDQCFHLGNSRFVELNEPFPLRKPLFYEQGIYAFQIEGFKIGIIDYFPKTQQFYRITIPQPILYNNIDVLRVFVPSDIRQRNIIVAFMFINYDFISLYVYFPALCRFILPRSIARYQLSVIYTFHSMPF